MKILIIGSKGFIGSHAFSYFSQKYKVWGADIVNDYNEINYFQVDATNADFNPIFAHQQFEVCINCSGAASVPLSIENPLRDFELNTHNVYKILNAIKKYSPNCKFINLSSAAVYGNPEKLPISEEQTLGPISPYGRHKYYSEQICSQFYQDFQISTISLRIFSAYGEKLKKQLFWDLYKKINTVKNNEINLWGTGNESRDYIYIKDILQAMELVILNAKFKGSAINIANQTEITIRKAVETFIKLFKPEIKIKFSGQIREGDPINWCADISTLKKMGYKQQFTLEEGLKKFIEWLKKE